MRVDWSSKYMKLYMKLVLFTDESLATLDGPDRRRNGWVFKGNKNHLVFRRQQGDKGSMITPSCDLQDVLHDAEVCAAAMA